MNDGLRIFLARSRLRVKILQELEEKPQIASFLAKKIKKHREVVSRIFLDLQMRKLAICTNPKAPSFRYYKITNKGKKALKELRDLDFWKSDKYCILVLNKSEKKKNRQVICS